MLAVHARFTAHDGHGDDLLGAVEQMFSAGQEPGTLVYAAHRDRDAPDAVVMYELYESDAAFDDNGASAAASRFGDALDDLLAVEPEVWLTRPVRSLGLDPVDT